MNKSKEKQTSGRQWQAVTEFETKLKEQFKTKQALAQFLDLTRPRLDRMLTADNLHTFLFYIPVLSEEMNLSPNEITYLITGKQWTFNRQQRTTARS